MIIPVRCFTCGKVICDKWQPFVDMVQEKKGNSSKKTDGKSLDINYIDVSTTVPLKNQLRSCFDELACISIVVDNVFR